MTDKPIPNEKMKLIEYAENCYRGEPLTNKLFARIPKRLSVWTVSYTNLRAHETCENLV